MKLIKPYICFDEVKKEFKKIFDSGWFTKGKYIDEFRQVIKNHTDAKYCFPSTSATTALTLALKAFEIKRGDQVIISDFTWPATANVVEDLGAIPIFADVSLETFNMLPEELEKKITKKTKAVILVSALGNPSGILKIKDICQKNNLPLIEDAACSFGSEEKGLKCGNIADISCFSFHPRKLITTGEGGAITFNNQKLKSFFEVKLNHGAKFKNGKLNFVDYGYNYRLPELQALMGIIQIKKIDEIIKSRNKIRKKYIDSLTKFGFKAQHVKSDVVFNVQSMVFKVPAGVHRDRLINHLKDNSIEATLGTYCVSGNSYYKKKYKDVQKNAKYLEKNTITLPCYEGVSVSLVTKVISDFLP